MSVFVIAASAVAGGLIVAALHHTISIAASVAFGLPFALILAFAIYEARRVILLDGGD